MKYRIGKTLEAMLFIAFTVSFLLVDKTEIIRLCSFWTVILLFNILIKQK